MLEQIREIIAENLAIDVEKVTESADFKEDLDADSLDLFENMRSKFRKKTFRHSKQSAT